MGAEFTQRPGYRGALVATSEFYGKRYSGLLDLGYVLDASEQRRVKNPFSIWA